MIDARLKPLYDLFSANPELADWIRQLALAAVNELDETILTQPDGARHLTEKAISCHEANFEAVLNQIKKLDPSYSIACQKGCAHCCNPFIVTLPHEALNIADYVAENFTQAQRKKLLACGKEQDALIQKDSIQVAAANHNSPCPFLKDNACSIYEVRPLTCRNWISQNAELCRIAMESTPPKEVPNNIILMQQVTIIFAAHKTFLELQNMPTEAVPLLATLPSLLEDLEQSHADWLNGTLLYS